MPAALVLLPVRRDQEQLAMLLLLAHISSTSIQILGCIVQAPICAN